MVPLQFGSRRWGSGYWAAPLEDVPSPTVTNAKLATTQVDASVSLLHTTREFWNRLRAEYPAPRALVYTTFEQTVLPQNTVDMLNTFDGVVVPSQFNFDSFRASGVTVPISVVPHVVANGVPRGPTESIDPRSLSSRIKSTTFVVSVIGPWQARKAIASSIEAFLRAFGPDDDVLLIVKTSVRDFLTHTPVELSVARILAGHRRVPPVQLIVRDLSDSEMSAWMRRSDCFLSLSRGEGFGLTIAEAIAAGAPAVITGWSAPLEYLGLDYPLVVDHDMVEVASEPTDGWAEPVGEWARANIDHAASLLRWVYENREAAAGLVAAAQRQLAATCAPHIIAPRLFEVLGLRGGFGPESRRGGSAI